MPETGFCHAGTGVRPGRSPAARPPSFFHSTFPRFPPSTRNARRRAFLKNPYLTSRNSFTSVRASNGECRASPIPSVARRINGWRASPALVPSARHGTFSTGAGL